MNAVEIGPQFLRRRIAVADLADFAAKRNRHALRFQCARNRRQTGAQLRVRPLLLDNRTCRQVDQGRGIDVDIEESGGHRLGNQPLQRGNLRSLILGKPCYRNLEMVTLQEDRTAMPLGDGGAQDRRCVFVRPLPGKPDFAARQFKDHRPGSARGHGLEYSAGGFKGNRAHIDRRDGEAAGERVLPDTAVQGVD